jgi:hypothetical protein
LNKHKVIPLSRMPGRLPITSTIAWYLLLDRLDAAEWVWGAMAVLVGVSWVIAFIKVCFVQDPTDLEELQ